MQYKNVEIHNIGEIVPSEKGITWIRVPKAVFDGVETEGGKDQLQCCTGVEIRFVIKSGDSAKLIMRCITDESLDMVPICHVWRGGIQGGWEDHEVNKYIGRTDTELVIKKTADTEHLKRMTKAAGTQWDGEVIRVIFDRGKFELIDIIGDVQPPRPDQMPKKTLLSYGSSITHGSNAIDASHSWTSQIAHNLDYDLINLGMAGSCHMEESIADHIASEGEKGNWDVATLELGINVLDWENDLIDSRVTNIITQVAGRNPDKNIFVISPFYCDDDFTNAGKAANWRKHIKDVVDKLQYKNVTYINGTDILGEMKYISADAVHPNIYGVQQIADKLTKIIKQRTS